MYFNIVKLAFQIVHNVMTAGREFPTKVKVVRYMTFPFWNGRKWLGSRGENLPSERQFCEKVKKDYDETKMCAVENPGFIILCKSHRLLLSRMSIRITFQVHLTANPVFKCKTSKVYKTWSEEKKNWNRSWGFDRSAALCSEVLAVSKQLLPNLN